MALNKQDKLALKILVKQEINKVEKEEKEYAMLEVNSPLLSSLLLNDRDLPFLASREVYHQFLLSLEKKL